MQFSALPLLLASEQDSDFHTKINKDLKYIPFVEKTERVSLGDDELPPPDQTDMDLN